MPATPKRAEKQRRPSTQRPARKPPSPRVVYTQAPMMLGTLRGKGAQGWQVQMGTVQRELPADALLDPALLEEAWKSGARVVVDCSGAPVIAGLLVTGRALRISREGNVDEEVNDFRVSAGRGVLLRAPDAFVQLKTSEVEIYGNRVLTRARELIKILGRMIKLN